MCGEVVSAVTIKSIHGGLKLFIECPGGVRRAIGGKLVGTALVIALAGCADIGVDPGPAPASRTTADLPSTPSTTREESVPVTEEQQTTEVFAQVPDGLVGVWISSGGDATISYAFESDGSYAHAGILTQPRSGGAAFKFVREEEGQATVQGTRISLRPTRALLTREDPDDPGGNYTNRPGALAEKQFTWQVRQDELLLSGSDGNVFRMRRE